MVQEEGNIIYIIIIDPMNISEESKEEEFPYKEEEPPRKEEQSWADTRRYALHLV